MLRPVVLACAAAACAAAAYVAMWEPAGSPATSRPAAEQPRPAAAIAPEKVPETPPPKLVDRQVRNVTPPGVTPGPKVTGPLVQIAPPPRPEKRARAEEDKPKRLYRPNIAAAGLIGTSDGPIRLAGIEAPGPDELCGAAGWHCGRMARAALRQFIRGRAIECDVRPGTDRIADPALCRVGGQDIAEWLVEQGWARPDGGSYSAAADKAQAERLGLWGDGPGDRQAAAPASSPDSALEISPLVSPMP
jgi:endonuclease YncB( thermonuclease family)